MFFVYCCFLLEHRNCLETQALDWIVYMYLMRDLWFTLGPGTLSFIIYRLLPSLFDRFPSPNTRFPEHLIGPSSVLHT